MRKRVIFWHVSLHMSPTVTQDNNNRSSTEPGPLSDFCGCGQMNHVNRGGG